MKTKRILIVLCLFCTSVGFAQNKIFDKYANMDDVSLTYISKAVFQTINDREYNLESLFPNQTMSHLKGKVEGEVESLQVAYTSNEKMIVQMKKDFSQLITSKHKTIMHIKDGENQVNFYSIMKGDMVKELIMMIERNRYYMVVLLDGNFKLLNNE